MIALLSLATLCAKASWATYYYGKLVLMNWSIRSQTPLEEGTIQHITRKRKHAGFCTQAFPPSCTQTHYKDPTGSSKRLTKALKQTRLFRRPTTCHAGLHPFKTLSNTFCLTPRNLQEHFVFRRMCIILSKRQVSPWSHQNPSMTNWKAYSPACSWNCPGYAANQSVNAWAASGVFLSHPVWMLISFSVRHIMFQAVSLALVIGY